MRGKNVLENINRAGVKLLKQLTADETYATIVSEAVKLVGADHGSIFLPKDNVLERVYTSLPALKEIQIRKRGYTYRVFKTRQVLIVSTSKATRIHPELRQLGIKSNIRLPLFYRNKSMGVLAIYSSLPNLFDEKNIDILKLFSSIASLSIRRLEQHLETQKALETRNLFISMAAHELRTPLTTINGYVQLLQAKLTRGGSSSPEVSWIQELVWETSRLTNLVHELLQVDRIKVGQLQYTWQECSLKEVISRAISSFKFSHPDRMVVFKCQVDDGLDVLVADADKLLQVVINLLDNAAKFSPPTTDILVNLGLEDGYLFLSVRDQGYGIDKKEINLVFEEFYRGVNNETGMGLGLFLAKNIIKQHHGNINIYSKIGKGTRVEIKLPIIKHD